MAGKEYYTLQESIEWIAFRKESKNITADILVKNTDKLESAKIALIQAIKNHKITVKGQKDPKSEYDMYTKFNHPEYNYLALESEKTISDWGTVLKLYPESNKLVNYRTTYENVKIQTQELKEQFPAQQSINDLSKNGYSTPYLEIMAEVIKEENITEENQSKKEILTEIMKNKMMERNLDQSDKIAGVMATIIRLPSSQKGRNKKH